MYSLGQFAEEVWAQLKAWAAAHEAANAPSREACEAVVRQIAAQLGGRHEALPPRVVEFYAGEAYDMVAKRLGEPTGAL